MWVASFCCAKRLMFAARVIIAKLHARYVMDGPVGSMSTKKICGDDITHQGTSKRHRLHIRNKSVTILRGKRSQ